MLKRVLPFWASVIFSYGAFAQNQAPDASPDFYTGFEEVPIPLFPLSNDSDPDGNNLNWRVLFGPFNGTLDTIFGTVVYRGDQDFYGADFILYRACDDGTPVRCATSTIFINVMNRNDAPVARNDTFTMQEDGTILMNVLANDDDADNDPLNISAITQNPTKGTATIVNNRIQYKPNANYYGTDDLRYRVCDTSSGIIPGCAQARVHIIIIPVNDKPVAENDSLTDDLYDSTAVVINVLTNDHDIENHPLHVTAIIPGSGISDSAVFSFDSLGNISVVSAPCGVDSFWYVMCDISLCDTGVVYLNLTCPPPPPPANPEALFLPEGFSPDGDGINDYLVFKGIDSLRPANIKVFNRYGNIVYESGDYMNDWNGTLIDAGEPIPDGTYFYVLKLSDGSSHPNYLVINR